VSSKGQIVPYKAAEIIGQILKPHTTAESVILPTSCRSVKTVLGDEEQQEMRGFRYRTIHFSEEQI
jgi:hypothetical protein